MAWHDLVPHTNNYSTAGKFTPSFRDVIFFLSNYMMHVLLKYVFATISHLKIEKKWNVFYI